MVTAGLGSVLPFPELAVTHGHCVGFRAATRSRNVPAVYGSASLTRSRTAGARPPTQQRTPTRMAVGGARVPPAQRQAPGGPAAPKAFLHQHPRKDGTGPFRKRCCCTCSGWAFLWVPRPWVRWTGCNHHCPADLKPAELHLHTQDAASPQLPPAQPCAPSNTGYPREASPA